MVHPKSQYIEGDGPFMDYDPTIQKTQVKSIAKEPESMSKYEPSDPIRDN